MQKDDAKPLTLLEPQPRQPITWCQLSILICAIFLKGGLLGAYIPFSSLWLSKKGYSPADLGIVSLVDAVCSLLLPVAGAALDKLRAHNCGFVILLTALTFLKCTYLVAKNSFVAILMLTAVTAPMIRASNSILDALALYAFAERGHFSRVRLVGDLGFGTIAMGVGLAMKAFGTEDAIYYVFACICASLAVLWIWASPYMESIRPDTKAMPFSEFLVQVEDLCKTAMAQKGVGRSLMMLMVCGGTLGLVSTFEFVLLDAMMGSSFLLGLCKMTGTIFAIPAWWYAPMLLDRLGLSNVLLIGLGCAGLRVLVLGVITNPWYALFSECLAGPGGFALAYSSTTIFAGRIVDEEMKGTATTVIYTIFQGLGAGSAPILGSLLVEKEHADAHSIQAIFLWAAGFVAVLVVSIVTSDMIALACDRSPRPSLERCPEAPHP